MPGSDDFIIDNDRINVAGADVFKRDPVNLIRMFRLAQKHNLAFHPDAMRTATRSLKLIDAQAARRPGGQPAVPRDPDLATTPEIVLRRMNETGVLGRFIPDFGKIVAMMQFNMYHHYTVDEHLIRCIGILPRSSAAATTSSARQRSDAQDPAQAPRACSTSRCSCTTSPRAGPRTIRSPAPRSRGGSCPRFGFNAAETERWRGWSSST